MQHVIYTARHSYTTGPSFIVQTRHLYSRHVIYTAGTSCMHRHVIYTAQARHIYSRHAIYTARYLYSTDT